MLKKLFGGLTSEIHSFRNGAFWLSFFALFSQILALFRDRLLAHHFGASLDLDIYYSSFRVPDLVFATIASLVSVSVLIPMFAKKEGNNEDLKKNTDSVFTFFFLLMIFSCVLVWVFMSFIIRNIFSFETENIGKIISLSRILLLSPFFLGISNFFGSILQYQKRFVLYSISPLLYNAGIIIGIVFGVFDFGIKAVVFGVLLGAFLHLLLPFLFIFRSKMRPRFTTHINWKEIFELVYVSLPRTFTLSISTFVVFVFVALASSFGEGFVSVFNLAFNLQSAPLSLIGVSFSLATFPTIVGYFVKNDFEGIVENMASSIRQIIFWSLPITALVVVLRAHIVRVVLGSGNFDWFATRLTAGVLAIFVLSTLFQSIQLFLSRSLYAFGKTKLPLVANFAGGLFAVSLAFLFIKKSVWIDGFLNSLANILNLADLPLQILILPLSYFAGSILTCLLLWFAFGDLRFKIYERVKPILLSTIITSLFLMFAVVLLLKYTNHFFDLNSFVGIFSHGAFAGGLGIILWALLLYAMKNEEIMYILNKWKR